jgi:hypothetical protein
MQKLGKSYIGIEPNLIEVKCIEGRVEAVLDWRSFTGRVHKRKYVFHSPV